MDCKGNIDFKKLEKELVAAVDADKKYQLENDAKIRAVTQGVPSYDDFRNIVLGAHLNPLDKDDKQGLKARMQPWNTAAALSSSISKSTPDPLSPTKTDETKTTDTKYSTPPTNSRDFNRIWKQLSSPEERCGLLLVCGGVHLSEIFHTEVGAGLLVEFITALDQCFSSDKSAEIRSVLEGLGKTKRFSLSLDFMSSADKETMISLFNKLHTSASSEQCETDDLNQLSARYSIS